MPYLTLLMTMLLCYSASAAPEAKPEGKPEAAPLAGDKPAGETSAPSAPKCDDAGQIYRICSDQAVAYQSAEQGAQGKNQKLIVVVGAEWCPWCHSLHRILKDPAAEKKYEKDFAVFELGLFREREKVASGQAVLEKLMAYAGEKAEPKGLPMLIVVDPVKQKARFIDTEKLEKNTATNKGHDADKVLKAIRQAANSLPRTTKR